MVHCVLTDDCGGMLPSVFVAASLGRYRPVVGLKEIVVFTSLHWPLEMHLTLMTTGKAVPRLNEEPLAGEVIVSSTFAPLPPVLAAPPLGTRNMKPSTKTIRRTVARITSPLNVECIMGLHRCFPPPL